MGILTALDVKSAKVETGEQMLADGDGLYLRVRPSGKAWVYRYTADGKTRKLQIGTYPAISLAEARAKALELTRERNNGVDPVKARAAREEEQRQAEAAQAARITVRDLFDRWMTVEIVGHKDGGDYVRATMERHALPHLEKMLATDVRKGHITGVVDRLTAAGKTRTAKVVFSLLRQMFGFAVSRDVVEFDPSSALKKREIVGGRDIERDRVLTEAEIRELTRRLPGAGLKMATEAAIWLALSTCCRIGEILSARWADVDVLNRTWAIPDTKNGRPHVVYLSDFALGVFNDLKAAAEDRRARDAAAGVELIGYEWVFPNRERDGAVCLKTTTKQISDRQREGKPMSGRSKAKSTLMLPGGKWTMHDLRRTGSTMMVALGVTPAVVERCLNHVEQNRMMRIYQRHSYESEMKRGWQLLGERLALLARKDISNVVVLNKTA